MTEARMKYSIVIPVFNAVNTLEKLISDLHKFVGPLGEFEIVLVDDCSTDKSWILLKQLKANRSFMKVYRLSNNFGQAAATLCGIHQSSGDVIITMDDDLQYPAREVPRMIRFFHQNDYHMVLGIPKKKRQPTRYLWAEKLVRLLFWLRPSGHLNGHTISSSFRIVTARLKNSSDQRLHSIHLANLLLEPRFIGKLPVDHQPNLSTQKSRYSFKKRLENFTDILLVFNKNPLSWLLWPVIFLGMISLVGFLLPLFDIQGDWYDDLMPAVLSGVSAMILVCLMIIGKYVGHIHARQLGLPSYLIIESHE